MTRDLVIIGCGGFGREVADVVDAINAGSTSGLIWNLLGFLDDSPTEADSARIDRIGSRVLGSLDENLAALVGTSYVIGIGNGIVRQTLATRADEAGLVAATLTHPKESIGADTSIGEGSVLCTGVAVTTNVVIGRHVHINLNSTVGHDSRLSDFVTVNPLVVISGNCEIGQLANLGTHACILPGVSIGRLSTVDAAACVTKDVPESAVVKGVPAR